MDDSTIIQKRKHARNPEVANVIEPAVHAQDVLAYLKRLTDARAVARKAGFFPQ